MLYLGEGGKTHEHRIGLTNTDFKVLNLFIAWLEKFLKVDKKEIKAQLHLYEDMDIDKEVEFWKNKLGISKDQFYKPSIRELKDSSYSYKESYRHGTCAVYVLNTEKKRELMMAMKAFLNKF